MSFFADLKAQGAVKKQNNGDVEGAKALYEEALSKGMNNPRYLLAYSVLLLRNNEFERAKEILVKIQKVPGLSKEQKFQMYINYAVCCYKLGDMERALDLLEKQFAGTKNGLIYETLGYVYVEAGDLEKALAFNTEAVEYDEEDAICLDNLAQTYYRLADDKRKAKEYFDAAYKIRPGQIDTLYFLALYDIEDGKTEDAIEKLEEALNGRFSPMNFATKEKVTALLDSLKA
jgi:Cytochrome c biogenesis factor